MKVTWVPDGALAGLTESEGFGLNGSFGFVGGQLSMKGVTSVRMSLKVI